MISLHEKFIRLLRLEIESMHDEVELILNSLHERHARHEITDYVHNENGAILRNELLGLESFIRDELVIDPTRGQSVDALVKEVRLSLRQRCAERDYVPALFHLIDRRLSKIEAYLDSTPLPAASS